MVITIKIPGNIARGKETIMTEISDDFIMIEKTFLKFLHRSWIKVDNKEKILDVNGGFIVKCTENSVFLRVPAKKDTFEIKFDEDTFFYIKNDDPNYISLAEIKVEKSRIDFTVKRLVEKEKYLQKKIQEIENLQKSVSSRQSR
jgi:hypothetical protein